MEIGDVLRIVMVAEGVLVMMETILSLSKRRMKEQFCLVWGVFAILLVVAGIVLRPTIWSQYISESGTIILTVSALGAVWCLYYLSVHISVLNRKTQELAMQVSLLNQENEQIMAEREKLREKKSLNEEEE